MSKQNYTPGPWSTDLRTIYANESPINNKVAEVYQDIIYRDADKLADANARLIAAAPEMLEALVMIVEKLSPMIFKLNIKKYFSEKVAMEAGRSAIKKALGE